MIPLLLFRLSAGAAATPIAGDEVTTAFAMFARAVTTDAGPFARTVAGDSASFSRAVTGKDTER